MLRLTALAGEFLGQVGIIQFSNDVRVELHPTAMDGDAFTTHVSKMVRNSPLSRDR